MTLEDDLRVTLRDRAAEPSAPQPDLLDSVSKGVRRARQRSAVVAAAILVAVITVPVALAGERAPRPAPPAAPTPSTSPSSDARAWAPPQLEMPTFPLKPDWTPPGLGAGHVDRLGPNVLLTYEESGVLSVEVGPVAGDWGSEGDEDHSSTVGDQPATVRTAGTYDGAAPGDRYVGVRWQLPDGRWAQSVSFGSRTEAQVLRFVRSLRPATLPASPAPFTFAVAPPGLTLQYASARSMCLVPQQVTHVSRPTGLCVLQEFDVPDLEPLPGSERLTVAGRPATFGPGGTRLRIDLGDRRRLAVYCDTLVPLTRDDLIRFAEGITVNG